MMARAALVAASALAALAAWAAPSAEPFRDDLDDLDVDMAPARQEKPGKDTTSPPMPCPAPAPAAASPPPPEQQQPPKASAAATALGKLPPGSEPPKGAIVAERLKDFADHDNSLVFPQGTPNAPEIENITELGPRTFNCLLRHRGNPWTKLNPRGTKGAWYDGDRDLEWNDGTRDGRYHDKSRAEMSGLGQYGKRKGPKYNDGETWDIGTTVRLDPTFVPSAGYCMIMQPVFDGSYVILNGIKGDVVTGNLTVFTDGIGSAQKWVRDFSVKRGEWVSLVVRVKFSKKGEYGLSVNGDEFKMLRNIDTTKARDPYSSKWGLYMTATRDVTGQPLKDSIVQHTNVFIRKV
jgi:hypothetical protein